VLSNLSGVDGFVGHDKNIGVVLLLADYQLPEIYRTCDYHGKVMVDSHAIGVSIVGDSPKMFKFGHVAIEAHALQPSMAKGFVSCNH